MTSVFFGFKSRDTIPKIRKALDHSRFVATFRKHRNEELPIPQRFDCMAPLGLYDYDAFRKLETHGADNFLIPRARAVETAHDKPIFAKFLVSNGFENCVPVIFNEHVDYPFIYKKRMDRGGIHSFVISSPVELTQLESRIDTRKYFRQEYVAGRTEYTTHIVAFDGRVRFASTFEFNFDCDRFVKGQWFQPKSKRQVDSPFLDIFQNILNALEFSGTCCFNYKIIQGVPKIFELNPRFGGSLVGDINSYLDAYIGIVAERRSRLCRPLMPVQSSRRLPSHGVARYPLPCAAKPHGR
jgi:hypothetical protein